jgi:tRNA(fMet)-specific endonuclease VapC
MKYLLDTNIISNLLRSKPAPTLLRHLAGTSVVDRGISSITVGELLFGALRIPEAQKYLAPINELVRTMKIVAFDEKAARRYAEIRATLMQQGKPIGDADTQIASIALARRCILVTRNTKHFSRVPGLALENWIDD